MAYNYFPPNYFCTPEAVPDVIVQENIDIDADIDEILISVSVD